MDRETTISISSGTIVRVFVIGLLFVAAYILRDILLIIITSVVAASAIEPATLWLGRYRLPRVLAVILMFAVFFALFVGLFYFFLPPILDDLAGFVSTLPEYLESLNFPGNDFFGADFTDEFTGLPLSPAEVITDLRTSLFDFSGGVFQGVNIVFGGVTSFILIVILSFYLAVQDKGIENFLRVVTPLKSESYIVDLWARTRAKIGLWMQGQLILGILMGILTYLGLTVLQVPYALLFALLAAVFELIPLFGPILAAVPAVIMAITSGGFSLGLMVVGFYIILQQFENHLIYPLVVRKVVGTPPLLVILALIIFGKLFGFLGLIIAVPAVTLILEMAGDLERRKKELGRGKVA